MEREGFGGTAEDVNKVIVSCFYGAFCQVTLVVVRSDKLVGHLRLLYLCAVGGGDFVVEDLVSWYEALQLRAYEGTSPGEDHFALGPVFHGFNP